MEKEKKTKEKQEHQIRNEVIDRIRILEHEIQQHISNLNFSQEQIEKLKTTIISKRGAVIELRDLLKEKEKETKENEDKMPNKKST